MTVATDSAVARASGGGGGVGPPAHMEFARFLSAMKAESHINSDALFGWNRKRYICVSLAAHKDLI